VGGLSDGPTEFLFDAGAGIDIRFESWGCMGLFGDYLYSFTDDDLQDFSMVRLGFKMPF